MARAALSRKNARLIAGILLLSLLFRALIPTGFMPARHAFGLIVCHDGMHAHAGGKAHVEHCPFGSAPASGPTPSVGAVISLAVADQVSQLAIEPLPLGVRLVHLPQARGPPSII